MRFGRKNYADNIFLLLRLLLERTLRPSGEDILVLKPWSCFLLLLFGWNVLFILSLPFIEYRI